MSFTHIATRSMPTVPSRFAIAATFTLVPTPSVPETRTGSRYFPAGNRKNPANPPLPPRSLYNDPDSQNVRGGERLAKKVGIVILGDEVLKAETRESNIAYMLPLLNEWGAEVALCAILPDDVPTAVRHLRSFLAEVDLLILTGGIGPTPDDITREAVATVARVPLVVHPEARACREADYGKRMHENRMVMAQ